MRSSGNGRFRETNESVDGFDRIPSQKDERTTRKILFAEWWTWMHQRLLLVCSRASKTKEFPTGLHQRLAYWVGKGNLAHIIWATFHYSILFTIGKLLEIHNSVFILDNSNFEGKNDGSGYNYDQLSTSWGNAKLFPKHYFQPGHPRIGCGLYTWGNGSFGSRSLRVWSIYDEVKIMLEFIL